MSDSTWQDSSVGTPEEVPPPPAAEDMTTNSSLEDLQTEEQRRVLDTVAQVRKCGLEGTLSLPQLVVCGDQSAGKSSVLEALTEIPFPRNDNLCTRFATEISLRRAQMDSLTIKVIPDSSRSSTEQSRINAFEQSITDFADLPRVMELAMEVMGITSGDGSTSQPRAFARDVLSIDIGGPNRPQLTLVDIPGLIATSTRGVTKADVDMVAEITDHYIKQPRTICLAVVTAMNDYANQKILEKVRDFDPDGDRTLGIITKPDGLAAGSGSETAFIDLAKNEDIFFKLGWHVLKNRRFEERDFSLEERNFSEAKFFRTSNFKVLPKESVGIDALRRRLSVLLFDHVKKELPALRDDLESALLVAQEELELMGHKRSTPSDCKSYLSQLSLEFSQVCQSAVDGHYEGRYFQRQLGSEDFSLDSPSQICRTRAVIQKLNTGFSETMHHNGHKYHIKRSAEGEEGKEGCQTISDKNPKAKNKDYSPKEMTKEEALKWVQQALDRTRGKELVGNFNPLLIGELFWDQSSKWMKLAQDHIDAVSEVCTKFLKTLLHDYCPKDIETRVWALKIEGALKQRYQEAKNELADLEMDLKQHPINYNNYYTNTISKSREDRQKAALEKALNAATTTDEDGDVEVDIQKVIAEYNQKNEANMDTVACEEVLDCVLAIYKVTQKTFIANVTTQVIERHIVRGLESIFNPVVVEKLEPAQAETWASEPAAAKRRRAYLEEQIKKLKEGQDIFKSVF